MNFNGYDIALITDEKERLYFLGYHSTDGYLVITKSGMCFVIDSRYFYAANKLLSKKGIKVVCGSGWGSLMEIAKAETAKTIGIDFTKTTISEYEVLKDLGFAFKDISQEIIKKTSVKTSEEIKYISKACSIAEKAWRATLPVIKNGVSEREVANELEYNFKKFGASGTSFDTIIAFGENAAVPHHETGNRRLKDNECVLMDFGCVYKGYCSDMTRTLFYGTPTEEFKMAYDRVLKAHRAAAAGITPGISGRDADKLARDVLVKSGYGEYFTHSLGHGIGVNIHESPTLSPKSDWTIEDNMVFSNEPGVYLNGKFGIRIEDSACLLNGEYKSFMKDDKSLLVLKGDGTIKKLK